MRLTMIFAGPDLFVQGEWTTAYGVHSKRLTEDMPPNIRNAAEQVCDWANDQEGDLRELIEHTEEAAALQNLITLLQLRLGQISG